MDNWNNFCIYKAIIKQLLLNSLLFYITKLAVNAK